MEKLFDETSRLLSRQSTSNLVDKDELVKTYRQVNEVLEEKLKTMNDRPWLMYTHLAIMIVLTVIAIAFYAGGVDFALTGMLLLIVYTVTSGFALKYWGLI